MNTKILSYFAAVSVIGTLAGIVLNGFVIGLFATAVSTLILLIAAADYAPRRCYHRVLCPVAERNEHWPFAA